MAKTTRVGAAWIKSTQGGAEFISVSITNPIGPDFQFTLWPVQEKRGERSPDYDVTKQADAKPGEQAYQPRTPRPPQPDPDDDGPIPF